MFLSGLEIDLDQVTGSFPNTIMNFSTIMKNPLVVTVAYFSATLVLSYSGAMVLAVIADIKNNWYFSLIMVTTPVGIILPVIKSNLAPGRHCWWKQYGDLLAR